MRFRCLPLPFVALALAVAVPPSRAEEKTDPAQVARLVAQLGSAEYAHREEAMRALDALGPAALEALRRAAKGDDAEVRLRAGALVRDIERRAEAARFLEPQRLRLVYQDTPLAAAVADFTRKTGLPLKLAPGKVKEAGRRVTLDSGEVTLWEAYDQFCRKAGLVDATPKTTFSAAGGTATVSTSVIIVNGNMRVIPSDILRPETPEKEEPLLLADGTPVALPTHDAGALRLVALPPDTVLTVPEKEEGEVVLGLEASVEPRLRWQKAVGLRIDRAVDDQGQGLKARGGAVGKPPSARGNAAMFVNGVPVYADDESAEKPVRQAAVLLRPGDRPAKMLKELSGTLVVLVQVPPQELAAVDNVLRAAGKPVAGAGGSSLKVLEIAREDDGEVRLRLLVDSPPRGLDDKSALPSNLVMMVNGRTVGAGNDEPLSALNFALLDDRGRPFQAVKAVNTGKRSGTARELELSYQPEGGAGPPARFVYTGRRSVLLDVPFTLKDVPLP